MLNSLRLLCLLTWIGMLLPAGDRWLLAKPHAGGSNYFEGSLDEVAVYTEALAADKVWLHYRNGILDAPRDATPQSGPGPRNLDLADIVGHGNGLGTGTFNAGINPGTGALVAASVGNAGTITGPGFHPVGLEFVDGVFIPGAPGNMQIASTGLVMQHNYPTRDGNSWDHFRNGPTVAAGGADGSAPVVDVGRCAEDDEPTAATAGSAAVAGRVGGVARIGRDQTAVDDAALGQDDQRATAGSTVVIR